MTTNAWTPLALAIALGCASAGSPPPEGVTRVGVSTAAGEMGVTELHNAPGTVTRLVPAPVDSVWLLLPRVYEILELHETGAEPNRKVYGAQNVRPRRIEGKRLSTYVDCGMGPTAVPKADEYEITMTVLTQVAPAPEGGTVVQTLVDAWGKPRALTGNRIHCQSSGVLESRVGDLVLWVLVAGR